VSPSSWFGADGGHSRKEVLWEDAERVVYRTARGAEGNRQPVLVVVPTAEHPTPDNINRLTHEYGLRDDLDDAWAARPLELTREHGQLILVLNDPGGEPLDRVVGPPREVRGFLRLAIALTVALCRLHERGLVHRDIKPSHILAHSGTGQAWLTGFGIASRLPRERHSPAPPEFIAGTLAYMAPEQTGWMNRSIDSRSDLYSLGVTFYQMLTGSLPFIASDPMEWVHCHIARTAVPPIERLENVPAPVSAIIMKLLAKTSEERYQTAAGLESDLRRCLADWQSRARIDEFPLGEYDTPDRLLIPEKLYGRTQEIDALLASFDRVVVSGTPELVLVSGYSGIGKSSVVNELHKVLVPPRGLFASGKFDQYKRDIPYATLAQAFQSLVRRLLGANQAELQYWRNALQEALGPNGLLIVDLVPELKLIIGEQPPVPVLPPQDAQHRFQLVFRRFISVFARPEHPLALFLDDLQWLDTSTLLVLEDLLTQSDVRHLMVIGAYRDNEVDSSHPLMRKLEAIREAGAAVQEILLAPLARKDLKQLIVDSLRCDPERAASLAQLLHEKTAGNPFFAIQLLCSLAEEGLLKFSHREAGWSWDLKRIHAKGYTDNLVDLMVGKLSRLLIDTRKALQQLACLGNRADFALLSLVYEDSADEMHSGLREAVVAGLVLQSENAYEFLHDRVHEAAYSLIPENMRAEAHLRIGRLLAAHTPPEKREEAIFEIVNHLNRGTALISSAKERKQVAELNLIAGQRAKQSTAYNSALSYLGAARTSLTDESWNESYDLIFSIEFNTAECELLTTDMVAAENRLLMLAQRAKGGHDIAAVTRLRLTLYTTLGRSDRSVEVCLEYLERAGTAWSPHPTSDEVRREYERIWSQLGNRQIEELIDLPLMSNPDILDALGVLAEVVTPALFFDENLSSLVICRMVNLSLEHGNSDGSCFAYVSFAVIAGPRFGNYKGGFSFGRLGYDLVEKRGLKRFRARTYLFFGNVIMPWTRHVRAGRDLVGRAFDVAKQVGDLTFAGYSCDNLITNLIATGDPLAEAQRQAENGLEFARKARFGRTIDNLTAQLALIRTLRGLTSKFGRFEDASFDEGRFEHHLASNPVLALPAFKYWVRKVQARFLAMEYTSAVDASLRADQLLWASPSFFETAELHFYGALSRAACWDSACLDDRRKHFEALATHYRQLHVWAKNCPENFANRAALANAEIARIEGRELDAQRLYEEAIRSARANGFVHNEAIANELAARFYAARGFETISHAYLRNARYCYVRWGADGKVKQLDESYPQFKDESPVAGLTGTIGAPVEHLDLATVIKVSQAVSGEIVLENLVDTLMRIAIAQAGAERGLLVLWRGAEPRIEARATIDGNTVLVRVRDQPVTAALLPEAVLNYVLRTKNCVVLDDAAVQPQFADDPYIRKRQPRSILCLPLITQAKLIGALYLENNVARGVFMPARLPVLKLLASQTAIALENAHLYRDLAQREAKIRRLVDADIIGICIWDLDGRILEANEAFLRMAGYEHEDLVAGRIGWADLMPADWYDSEALAIREHKRTGLLRPYEKEFFRRDGSRVPVLIGAATFEEGGNEGVAFVLDVTERKRAEAAARESEQRYREVQMELAHANRTATLGQLSASIAHEIHQPITAAITYADAALRWLRAQPPNLEEVRKALGLILESGVRAGDVIDRVRALVKKAPSRRDRLAINEVVLEVIALTRREMEKNRVSVQTQLSESLPTIRGDRVQLQQLILNLVINAIEAMMGTSEGPRELVISTAKADAGVLVTVQDSGPGLSPESVERLFEAFYTTKSGGLGMGLSICRSIIEAHRGRLWATNNAPRGAVFHFTLPAYRVSPN
jgi:PAS domain S-box-containing protein